ncbi:MAG: hypothetical protein FWE50_04045 [Alphaproteobacteria bacterium]|nr:hypothetical protein [Alphaproteobacteria bacterium]
MKKYLLCAGIFSAVACGSAFAAEMPLNGFIGLNLGATQIMYQDVDDSKYMPTFFGKLGFEGGIKFGNTENIYNIGATIFFDKSLGRDADDEAAYLVGVNSISLSYSTFGAIIDNYIRIGEFDTSTLYLVAGAGLGNITQAVTYEIGGVSFDIKQDATAFVAKLGGIYNFDEHMGLTFMAKAMFPDGLTAINYEVGFRYTF